MKASKYQEAIYDWVKNGKGSCVVEAIAGSGKTTVLKDVVKLIPDDKRVLMIAFNKSIVDELQRKIQQSNTKICTSHSLGFLMLKQHFKYQDYTPQLNVDEYKYRTYIKRELKTLTLGIEFKDRTEAEEFKEVILSLIDLCRFYLCETNEQIETIAEKYNFLVNSDHVRIIKNVINWGKTNLETIDFGDMVSLPNYLNIVINSCKYDWVLVDEAQDLSVAQQELVKRTAKKGGTRFIYVGDGSQCIQTFAGSDNEAFQKLKSLPNTISLPLSINYRCPSFVEGLARQFVPNFEVFNKQRAGITRRNVRVVDIKNNSMVICRKTQPLIELYLMLIKENRKCYIKGLDIGNTIIEVIERLDTPYIAADLRGDGVIPKLYKQLFEHRDSIMKKFKIDVYDATNESFFQRKLETINVIKALSEGITETYQLIDKCKRVFRQQNTDGICLITNHKAKGLENDVVYHLCPSLLPDKRAKKDWEIQTEQNLEYVLYTRTKNEFYTISEEDFPPPQGSKDIKELVAYLKEVEHMLSRKTTDVEKSNVTKKLEPPKPKTESQKKASDLMDKVMEKKKEEFALIQKYNRIMVGKTIEDCYIIFNDFGITSDINIATINGKPYEGRKKGKKDTINVDIDDHKLIVLEVVRIGK